MGFLKSHEHRLLRAWRLLLPGAIAVPRPCQAVGSQHPPHRKLSFSAINLSLRGTEIQGDLKLKKSAETTLLFPAPRLTKWDLIFEMGRSLHLITLWQDGRICAGNHVLCFSILMKYRKGAWNSQHVLHFTALKGKSKKAVKPLNTWSHRPLKAWRASWGKWSQCSHPGPSLFLKHLHLDCQATQMFALMDYPLSSALLLPSWMSGSEDAPWRWHQAQLQTNFQPAAPRAG